jgi:hypothetical protein
MSRKKPPGTYTSADKESSLRKTNLGYGKENIPKAAKM